MRQSPRDVAEPPGQGPRLRKRDQQWKTVVRYPQDPRRGVIFPGEYTVQEEQCVRTFFQDSKASQHIFAEYNGIKPSAFSQPVGLATIESNLPLGQTR